MFSKVLFAITIKVFLVLLNYGFLYAQNSGQEAQVIQWDKLASRAEEVVSKAEASNEALKIILSDLLKQRKEVSAAQLSSSVTINTLSAELDALGPIPDDGILEDPSISLRRKQLETRLSAANVPFYASSGMLERTDFLISEINRITRMRLTQKLYSFSGSPLNATYWVPTILGASGFFERAFDESLNIFDSAAQRALLLQKLPLIASLVFISLLSWFMFLKNIPGSLLLLFSKNRAEKHDEFFSSISGSIRFVLLFLSGVLVIEAIKLTGLIGFNGTIILKVIPLVILYLVLSKWLSDNFFLIKMASVQTLREERKLKRSVQQKIFLLGIIFSVNTFVEHIASSAEWSLQMQSIINFPLIALGGIWLFKFANMLDNDSKRFPSFDETGASVSGISLNRLLFLSVKLISIAAPVLALSGYFFAAQKLLYPIIATLFLIFTSQIIFSLARYAIAEFAFVASKTEGITKVESTQNVLTIFFATTIIFINIPLISLVWGAQSSDIYEIWLRLNEGIPLGSARLTLRGFVSLIVIFALGYALTQVVQRMLKNTVLPKTRLDSGGRNAIISGVGYSGIILSTMFAISSTGLDLSSLAIVAGALSVGLGFGLQTIVSNFVSGVILLIERPIKEGDWIEVAGFSGTVRKISVRSTQIQTFDRGTVIVPNSELIAGSVLNYTHSNSMGRVRVPVGVAYGSDPRKVEKILLDIASNHPQVLKDPGPSVVFMGFGADALNFEIRAYMKDVGYVLAIKSDMNFDIVSALAKENIEIPFAQRDIFIKNFDQAVAKVKKPSEATKRNKKND